MRTTAVSTPRLMCGIAGFWTTLRPPVRRQRCSGRWLGAIRHRGPDDDGVWRDAAAGVALGLPAAVDRRPVAGGTPADGVGERPLRHRLQRRDLQLPASCATSCERARRRRSAATPTPRCMLAGVRALGHRATRSSASSGMFAFALWDRASARCTSSATGSARSRSTTAAIERRAAVRLRAEGAARAPRLVAARSTATRSRCSCATATSRRRTRSTRTSQAARRARC